MLNITNKDKEFLSNFFAKNCDIKITLVRFFSYNDREKFVAQNSSPEIFVRREYNGVETYLYIEEDFRIDGHIYHPDDEKKNEVRFPEFDITKEKKGGIENGEKKK